VEDRQKGLLNIRVFGIQKLFRVWDGHGWQIHVIQYMGSWNLMCPSVAAGNNRCARCHGSSGRIIRTCTRRLGGLKKVSFPALATLMI
jgi:hypothetical protein